MATAFASQADLADKTVTFARLSDNAFAYTAEGDPNSGVVIGDDGVMVIDAQATPAMAEDVIRRVRAVTDKPIKYVVLTHYHAVRVLGASAYKAREIIASQATYEMIKERGKEDMASEIGRFPRLFRGAEAIPGLTWPTLTFDRELTLWMGSLEVRLIHVGAGHTRGDTIVWLPSQKVLFSGDLVEFNAGIYTGDAHLGEWPESLEKLRALRPDKLVPGRGPALVTAADSIKAIEFTQNFVRALYASAKDGVSAGKNLKQVYEDARKKLDPVYGQYPIYEHCMPFDVSRAFDEASGIANPRIWTAERDQEMWKSLQA
jgi:glyoxylase-like metal-dependent hydrolase (beta-lactamase superfamily II)